MLAKTLPEGGCMKSEDTEVGKLGMRLGNSKLGNLMNRVEIWWI